MIEARRVRISNSAGVVLEDLSLQVAPGEIYVLLGPPGAGRTALVDAFAGMLTLESGRVMVGDVECAPPKDPVGARHRATFVMADAALYGSLAVWRNVQFLARMAGVPSVTPTLMRNALRHVGVPERTFDKPLGEMDRGTHLLVWLALAAIRKTQVLVVDEPLGGIDGSGAGEVDATLSEFRHRGTAILIVTSDFTRAMQLADRIGLLCGGRLVREWTRAQVLGQSVAQFHLEYSGAMASMSASVTSSSYLHGD